MTTPATPSTSTGLAAALAEAAGGGEHVRGATTGDSVAGVAPRFVVSPGDEAEMAGVLQVCGHAGAVVAPRGGGTAMDWGAPPHRCDVIVSTERMSGVVDHAAADMVCVVRAGTPLRDLQAVLAGAGQRLAIDPPRPPAATIGGILATDHAGGLRHRHGTPRDLLIGARFVLGDGTVGCSGGRVVKNVAGYDIGRLLCGSLGSLAVIVEAAFKLHPLPAATAAVVLDGASASRLAAAAATLRAFPAPIAALDLHWPQGRLVARLEGTAAGVAAGGEAAARAVDGDFRPDVPDGGDPRLAPWTGDGVIAGVGVPLPCLGDLLEACSEFGVEAVVRGGTGVAELRMPAEATAVAALRAAVERLGGHLSLRRGGSLLPDLVWGDGDAVALDLARAVKCSLDPAATLPSGRRQGDV